jgi:predicted permease
MVLDNADSVSENLIKALSSSALWSALLTCLALVFLGYFIARKDLLPKNASLVLSKIVLEVALPCLAFVSFMVDFTESGAIDTVVNLVLGFFLYLLFMGVSKYFFFFVKDPNKRKILALLFTFGSGTFFCQPLIQSLYGSQAYNDSNLLNIPFRVFLYSYVFIAIGGSKIAPEASSKKELAKRILLNPILIGTFLGLILWSLQALPGAKTAQWWTLRKDWLAPVEGATPEYVPIWRFDVSLPWVHAIVKMLGGLSSPLIYMAIGLTLGEKSIKEAAQDRLAWIYAVLRVFVGPLVVLAILFALQAIARACGYSPLISLATVQSTFLMWMAPPAVVATAYCLEFDNEKELASDASLLATICYLPGLVIDVLLLSIIGSLNFFYVA